MRESYQRNRGKLAEYGDNKGIVCGYSNRNLIMAVTVGHGWTDISEDDNIFIQANEINIDDINGFLYISEYYLLEMDFRFGR